ncbi:MAG: SdrD B-like domain-containing protein [bacterium]
MSQSIYGLFMIGDGLIVCDSASAGASSPTLPLLALLSESAGPIAGATEPESTVPFIPAVKSEDNKQVEIMIVDDIITIGTQSQDYIYDVGVANHGNWQDMNFGDINYLGVWANGHISGINDHAWRTYISFDIRRFISDMGYSPDSVTLKNILVLLTTNLTRTSQNLSFEVHVPDTTWDENNITWNNQPTFSSTIFSYVPKKIENEVDRLENDNLLNRFIGYLNDPNESWKRGIVITAPNAPNEADYIFGVDYNSSENELMATRPKVIISFSLQSCASLCGAKFQDLDRDGGWDPGEPGLPGWTIHLMTPDEESLEIQVTDENGYYCFDSIQPGDYVIAEEIVNGWFSTNGISRNFTVKPEDCNTTISIAPFGNHALEGCMPLYWSDNPQAWGPTGYSPKQKIKTLFSLPPYLSKLGNEDLIDALLLKDKDQGKIRVTVAQLLLREAVAALLNASHTSVSYPMEATEIIKVVNEAIASEDAYAIIKLALEFEQENNRICPLP